MVDDDLVWRSSRIRSWPTTARAGFYSTASMDGGASERLDAILKADESVSMVLRLCVPDELETRICGYRWIHQELLEGPTHAAAEAQVVT